MEKKRQEELALRLDELKAAEVIKERRPKVYLEALVKLVNAYRMTNQNSEAVRYFDKAIEQYSKVPDYDRSLELSLWQTIRALDYGSDFPSKCKELLELSERKNDVDRVRLDENIGRAIDSGQPRMDVAQRMQIWQAVIDLRRKTLGQNDPALFDPLQRYARACESGGNMSEAENAFKQCLQIQKNPSDSDSNAAAISLLLFYVRNGMLSKQDEVLPLLKLSGKGSKSVARQLCTAAGNLAKNASAKDWDRLVDYVEANAGSNLPDYDEFLQLCLDKYTNSGKLDRVQSLLERRVAFSHDLVDDPDVSDFREKLSNLYLSLGRTADSQNLFKNVVATKALQGASTHAVRERRSQFMERIGEDPLPQRDRTERREHREVNDVRVKYSLLSFAGMSFGQNTTIGIRAPGRSFALPPRPYSSEPAVCSLGQIEIHGNFMSGTVYGAVTGQRRTQSSSKTILNAEEIESMPRKFGVPSHAIPWTEGRGIVPPHKIASQDYVADGGQISLPDLQMVQGSLRIFIKDSDDVGAIMLVPRTRVPQSPGKVQVFYAGTTKIKVSNDCACVIYAPNSTVEIQFNARFSGAIIANRIEARGNNRIEFDPGLKALVLDIPGK